MHAEQMRDLRISLLDPANNRVREDEGAPQRTSLSDLSEIKLLDGVVTLGGGMLLGYGLSRRSLSGLVLAGVGAYLTYTGLKGLCGECVDVFDLENGGRERGSIQDRVDEASWESFPASDPPSYNPSSV